MTISSNQLRSLSLNEEEYGELLERLRKVVAANVGQDSTVLVVSKGDEALLELDGRTGWHFPRQDDGSYPGFYPADSAAAIAQLEELKAKGADYLVLPAPAFWWLEHYPQFAQHLEMSYRIIARDDSTCLIFGLKEPEAERKAAPASANAHFTHQLRSFLDALLPPETSVILVGTGDPQLAQLESPREVQFLQLGTGLFTGAPEARQRERIEYLRHRQAAGAEFLVVRGAHHEHARDYEEFVQEAARHYRQVAHQERFCTVFDLGMPLLDDHQPAAGSALGRLFAGLRNRLSFRRSPKRGGDPRGA